MNSYTQPVAGSITDPINAYNLTVSPVTLIAGHYSYRSGADDEQPQCQLSGGHSGDRL